MEAGIEREVRRYAHGQKAVISREQALTCGLSPKQISHAVRSGRWKRIHRGVYLTNSGQPGWHARAWAAVLCAGPGAVLTHSAAAHLWGLEEKAPSILRLSIPPERTIVRPLGTRVVRRRRVEATKRQGLPVSTVRQTILDLTAQPGFTLDETAALLGRAAQRELLAPEPLIEALDESWHHPMDALLRRACDEAAEGVESSLESRILRAVVRAHGLPDFALQVPLGPAGSDPPVQHPSADPAGAGPKISRSDLRNAALGIRIEGDGVAWHGDTFHEDRRRDRKTAAAGDLTVRVTWVAAERPCEVALDLALTMTHRGWNGVPSACGPSCEVVDLWAATTGRVAS